MSRLRGERLTELLQRRAEPRGLADDMLSRFVYAPGARYGIGEGGSEQSVGALTRDDVLAFFRARYVPGSTTVIAVGGCRRSHGVERMVAEVVGGGRVVACEPSPRWSRIGPRPMCGRFYIVRKVGCAAVRAAIGACGAAEIGVGLFLSRRDERDPLAGCSHRGSISISGRRTGTPMARIRHLDWRRGAGPFEVSTAVARDVYRPPRRERSCRRWRGSVTPKSRPMS